MCGEASIFWSSLSDFRNPNSKSIDVHRLITATTAEVVPASLWWRTAIVILGACRCVRIAHRYNKILCFSKESKNQME